MPDAAPYCTRKPAVGDRVDVVCPDCGHWLPTHIGVEHCPVCEMADLNAQTWHEKLLSGQKSINDHRRAVGMPPLGNTSKITPGWTGVHWLPADAGLECLTVTAISADPDGMFTIEYPGGGKRREVVEDQTGRLADSWHWPCAKSEREAKPEPDAPPTTVNIYATGGVLTERQVGDMVERAMLRAGVCNPTTYSPYRRR